MTIIVAALVGLVGATLVIGFVLAGVFGERGDIQPEGYGIATVDGVTTVVVCDVRGISDVAIADDRDSVVWSAMADRSGDALSAVSISSEVPGYRVDGAPVHSENEYRLTGLSVNGSNVLVTQPSFTPGDIPEGSVLTGEGTVVPLAEFETSTRDCVL